MRRIIASVASHNRAAFSATTSKHRLNIRRRAGNDPQDFTRGRLLLQRFLQFLEQPDVLNGDDRLVGEGFEKGNLFVRKRSNFRASNENRSNRNALSQQRRAEY